ncbi:MAG: chromate resistance protein ChrB domain-containing protein [Betaproteobacteria bacterium]
MASLPTEDPSARMRMVRTLESLGAAMMREGVYLLPDAAATRQGLEHLSEYIARNGGSAHVLQVSALNDAQRHNLRNLFDRSGRYAELVKVIESLKVGYGMADPSALSGVLHKQRREFEAIAALDFFPTEARERAAAALAEADAQIRRLMFPTHTQGATAPAQGGAGESMLGRTWATRQPPWADRLACAWLVRRFIDPEGAVLWLDKTQPCPDEAVGFAFDGARFGNSQTRVTFEEMLRHFGLAKNAALAKIGAIVRYLEIRDTPVPEAAGVQTLLQGAQRRSSSNDELLSEAEKTFDLLYEAYFEAKK